MLATLKDVLRPGSGKAVGLFNTVNLELARGTIAAAEELGEPVVIGTAEILLPYGPLEELSWLLLPMARRAKVPVVVHLDHGLNYDTCVRALELGFSSVMYDCSTDSYEENVRKTAEMAKTAHSYGASIEAELGHVGDNDAPVSAADGHIPEEFYTSPEQARDFVSRTGVDALAVAVGTAHGAYRFPPRLDFERISRIREAVDCPLVLHGGSGLSDADFREAIRRGVAKINIFTDVNAAAARAAHDGWREGFGLTDLIPGEVEAVKAAVLAKMRLFSGN